jgi:urease accessory protein
MKNIAANLMHMLQFTDSTFPVGTFSFSNGLETAAHLNIVHDASTLKLFTRAASVQAAYTDGIAALHAFRSAKKGDYEGVKEADNALFRCKMNAEARLMLTRMGKKLAELGVRLFDDSLIGKWLDDIRSENLPGTYPVAQGLIFAAADLTETELFCSHQYGVINMILSAALRCVRVSHYDTQIILQKLTAESLDMLDDVIQMKLSDMNAFVPETDILASMHEKGNMRMFMN